MSIFTPPTVLTPAQQAACRIVGSAQMAERQMLTSFRQGYAAIWNNPNATPDQVVAALGTQAVKVFTAANGLATYLNSMDPTLNLPTGIPSGWTFTANADGSATLTQSA